MELKIEMVKLEAPLECNLILGQSHFIKTVEDLYEAVKVSKLVTRKGKICLLSPAAASYGFFKNFEDRGNVFKKLVMEEA
jgi:UDP-N-acetylmuramoylalanine-D-glutamate ligase